MHPADSIKTHKFTYVAARKKTGLKVSYGEVLEF
jgi:hypothetical protein